MSLVVKQTQVIEEIKNEKGEKVGELKFNPNDARIMSRLSKIVNDLTEAIKKIKSLGEIKLENKNLTTIEEFEKSSEDFKKLYEAFSLQEEVNTKAIEDLESIFGKNTIELFTNGSKDITTLVPLLEYITPYIKESSNKRIEQYTNKNNGVLE